MEKVLYHFEKICKIPRNSGNEKAIADFLVEFAKQHNFHWYKDAFNNVLIKKTNPNKKPILLQAHTDMVCVKDQDFDFDFSTQPIQLVKKGDYLFANKTSLGADNGIGVAMILSLLEEDNDCNIEALFTTDEEVTMTGSINFDYSLLSTNKAISFDGFDEEEIIAGCASICDMKVMTNNNFLPCNKQGYSLVISGLLGGHSGYNISNKSIGNAIKICAEILKNLKELELEDMQSGKQFNFIPNHCTTSFATTTSFEDVKNEALKIKQKYIAKYPALCIDVVQTQVLKTLSKQTSKNIVDFINNTPVGVVVGTPEKISLSQNLACVDLQNSLIKISMRGHDTKLEDDNIAFLEQQCKNYGFVFEIFDKQKGFKTPENSTLTTLAKEEFKKHFNKEIKPTVKHISIEGAIFADKIKDLDFIVVSPRVENAHSTKESVYIPSIQTAYTLAKNILKHF